MNQARKWTIFALLKECEERMKEKYDKKLIEKKYNLAFIGSFFLLPLILNFFIHFFDVWAALYIGIPYILINLEVIYYALILEYKDTDEVFEVTQHKSFAFGASLVLGVIHWFIVKLIKDLIDNFAEVVLFCKEYKYYFGYGLIALFIIVLVISGFKWWYQRNKDIAIKHLGKKRVK